ncbi:MAG: hypothetical protein VX055_01765, partial [Pseudomonadota bacterium]|nr:hypothetical protein [Pseudomonadota bacterium]
PTTGPNTFALPSGTKSKTFFVSHRADLALCGCITPRTPRQQTGNPKSKVGGNPCVDLQAD